MTITHELMISLKTVRNHVSNIFTKLQVSERAQVIVKAREAGLGNGWAADGMCTADLGAPPSQPPATTGHG